MLARLDATCGAVCVMAPAGFGKTSLVRDWLAHQPLPCAWLSLEPADDESPRLLAYLLAAFEALAPAAGALPAPDAAATLLLNRLADAPPGVLVLNASGCQTVI